MSKNLNKEQTLLEPKEAEKAAKEIFCSPETQPDRPPTVTVNTFIRDLTKEHAKFMGAVAPEIVREYLAGEKFFNVVRLALPHVKTTAHEKEVLVLLRKLLTLLKGAFEDHLKIRLLDSIANADPALFFTFCRQPILPGEQAQRFHKKLCKELKKRVPNREKVVDLISMYVLRRMLGDQSARTPLLFGPPGGGKTFAVSQLAKSMTAAGVCAEPIFQPMTQDNMLRNDNTAALRLLGSDLRYSNGTHGNLYEVIRDPEVSLGITLIDEADKSPSLNEFLVGLLDPKAPLEDNFVRSVSNTMDMRCKTLFLLTANDPSQLNSGPEDPLWSRLEPAHLPAYTEAEIVELAVNLATSPESPYQPTRREARKAARLSVAELGTGASFRALLDHMNGRLFRSIVLEEECAVALNISPVREESGPYRRTNIGFRV